MKKIYKSAVALILATVLAFSLSACAKTEMTEENITDTVQTVETALKEFDTKKLDKYVGSTTLSYIMKYADKHTQFSDLGKAIFANLSLKIESIDTENQTVTLEVKNKDLSAVAYNFASNLKADYSTLQLVGKLDDEDFLNVSLGSLVSSINDATEEKESTVTLKLKKGDKNLVLLFDDEGEDAVSGGALSAIKTIYN